MAHPIYKACILKGREGIMMRKQAEKDYRSETPADEVDFKTNLRQRAVDAANDKRFFQNASVRKFNSDLLKEKIRKDNAAMAASKRETERKADQQRREKEEETRQKCIDAQRKEEDESRKRRRDKLALKDELVKKTKEKKLSREKERQQEKVERDQLRALDEQHQQELRHEERKELEAKDKKAKLHKEEIYRKNCLRQKEIEKLNMKEKETKRVQTDREEVLQQRKQKKSEQFNKRQIPKDIVIEKLADAKKQQAAEKIQREKVKLSKDVAEAEAKVLKRQKDVKEKRAAALKSIATQRVEKHHENEQKEREEKEGSLDLLNQMKQCDRLSEEQNKLEVYFKRQNNIKHKVALISAAAEKQALLQQEIREEIHAAREMEKQIAEGEKAIQQYMQQVGEHLPAAERHRVLLNREVPDYVCRDTGEPFKLKRAPDPTRLMKRYREHDSLKQAMVDVRPHFLPPLSRAGDARHGSKDAGELLPTKVNSGWQRTPSPEEKIKQYLDKDKFQLNESSTADQRQTRFPTIKTPGAPAGRRSPPTGVESSKNHVKETGERLPRLDTPKTRDTKENIKGNLKRTLLPTIYKKNSEENLQRTLLPTIYKKNSEENLQRTLLPTIYKKNSEENLQRTLLPTIYKKNSEENLQRTLLPTIYKKNSEKNLQRTLLPTIYKKISEKNSTLLPTISTKNTPAVRIRSPQVVLQAHMTVTGEPLLRFATKQTKMIKRKQEQLTLAGRN